MTHLNWKITVLFGTNDQNVGGCYWCWKQIYIFHFYLKYQNYRLSQVVAWCRRSAFSRKIALQPMQSKKWNISGPKSSPHSKQSGIGEPLGGIPWQMSLLVSKVTRRCVAVAEDGVLQQWLLLFANCKLQFATEVVVLPLLCRLRRSSCCRFQKPQGSPSAEGAGWLSPCWSSSRSARRWRPQKVASPNPCLIYLDSCNCLTTDIELDSFTEWWKHIIWCWSIIWWFFTFYIFSSHKTKIMLLYKKMNFMTFHHMMTFHHIPYDGLSTS